MDTALSMPYLEKGKRIFNFCPMDIDIFHKPKILTVHALCSIRSLLQVCLVQ